VVPDPTPVFDEEVDLLVIGAGAAGMTAALLGTIEGLRTLLCEKTDMVGGTTATSAGTVWIPGSNQSATAGIPDSIAEAKSYLNAVVGTDGDNEHRAAFLESGPRVLDYLEAETCVRFIPAAAHPDYKSEPGAAYRGRALGAEPFDGRKLGADFARVRPPRPEFLVLGGMMVGKSDIPSLLHPFGSLKDLIHAARLLARQTMDRLRHPRGTRLIMGNALVARLLSSLRQHRVPVRFETQMTELLTEDGRVTGAIVTDRNGGRAIRANKGVVLATGGISWNAELRSKLFPAAAQQFSLAPATNTRTRNLHSFVEAGYLKQADTIEALAQHIGVDAAALNETIANHNRFAAEGVDQEFGRGSSDLNRFNGDPECRPNPCMRKIGPGPYFAVAVWPADLASSAGLRTDQDARVLDLKHQPIEGLYAIGADAASIFRGTYPGPGTMIGPAMVFGWRAAMHGAGKLK
jgi:predicted oxidoreductase